MNQLAINDSQAHSLFLLVEKELTTPYVPWEENNDREYRAHLLKIRDDLRDILEDRGTTALTTG